MKNPATNDHLATHFRVAERTVKRWRSRGAPLHDNAKMAEWAASQKNLPRGFLERLEELNGTPPPAPAAGNAADWETFLQRAKRNAADAPQQALAEITAARDLVSARFLEAARVVNRPDMRLYSDLLGRFESVIHDSTLRAKRLGVDSGELLARSEFERLIWAWGFWAMQSVNASLDGLTAKLAALAPGLGGEPVRAILDAELLSARFLTPFARASQIRSGVQLPSWAVDKLKTTVGDFLQDGELLFDELRTTTTV